MVTNGDVFLEQISIHVPIIGDHDHILAMLLCVRG